jgi:hypothetical protein
MGITFLLFNILTDVLYPIMLIKKEVLINESEASKKQWQAEMVYFRIIVDELGLACLVQMMLFIQKVCP